MSETLIILSPIFIIAFIVHKVRKWNNNKNQKIDDLIKAKQELLKDLTSQINEIAYDNSTTLSKSQINVLQIYEQSNIQIPVDILEELSHMQLSDEENILAFIENQRYYWKLENTKKPFKRKG